MTRLAIAASLLAAATLTATSTPMNEDAWCFDCGEELIPNGGECEIFEPVTSNYTHTDSNLSSTDGDWGGGSAMMHGEDECGSCEERHWTCSEGENLAIAALELAYGQRPESTLLDDREGILRTTLVTYGSRMKLVGRTLEVRLCHGKVARVQVPASMLQLTSGTLARRA